jgi:hypothetical protein
VNEEVSYVMGKLSKPRANLGDKEMEIMWEGVRTSLQRAIQRG